MDESPRPDATLCEPGAEDRAWRPALGLLAIAAGLVAGTIAWWWTDERMPTAVAAVAPAAASGPVAAGPPAAVIATRPAAPVRVTTTARASAPAVRERAASASEVAPPATTRRIVRGGSPMPDLADYVNDGDIPTTAEVIERLHAAGIQGGLAAFSPPGTRPPLVGLAVPEDFELPPGYVRHYQATDDGQRIEPILMFSPDYQFFDASGQRAIAIPENRVVPPELAPPGLPIRRIVIPAPAAPPGPGN
jgi:hypothetical protein